MIESQHPGYDVIEHEGCFFPVRYDGAAEVGAADYKGRRLSYVLKRWGEEQVEAFPFMDDDRNLLWFDNANHAHNFLNKWVREQIGLGRAIETWEARQIKQAHEIKNLPAILDSLEAKRAKYETIARAHEAAIAMVKLIDEGKMNKETARQIFVMVEGQAAHPEVQELYRDLSARI